MPGLFLAQVEADVDLEGSRELDHEVEEEVPGGVEDDILL